MIERQKAKYGWEFLFLGANIDAVETASQFGIGADRAVNYQCDSALLVTKMQAAAKEEGIDAEIFACPASEADEKMEQQQIDCVLLGPQVSYMKADFENKVKGKGKDGKDIPLDVINMQDYGMMNGKNVLAQAEKLIKG